MANIKLEDIVFWLLIAGIIAVALWMLHGSPTETSALIAIALFVAGSEMLLWRALFAMDKRTAIGFEKMKSNIDKKHLEINNQLNEIKHLIKK